MKKNHASRDLQKACLPLQRGAEQDDQQSIRLHPVGQDSHHPIGLQDGREMGNKFFVLKSKPKNKTKWLWVLSNTRSREILLIFCADVVALKEKWKWNEQKRHGLLESLKVKISHVFDVNATDFVDTNLKSSGQCTRSETVLLGTFSPKSHHASISLTTSVVRHLVVQYSTY